MVVDVPSLRRHQVISRQVETRTKDDFAALQDLPRGQHQYAHSFPLIPTFDALSYFRVTFNGNRRDLLSYVEPGAPLTYTDPRLTSHADVVVTSLKFYHASYAADSNDRIAHILMETLPSLTRDNPSDFFIHDVFADTVTELADESRLRGADHDVHVRLRGGARPLARAPRQLRAHVLRAAAAGPHHGDGRRDEQRLRVPRDAERSEAGGLIAHAPNDHCATCHHSVTPLGCGRCRSALRYTRTFGWLMNAIGTLRTSSASIFA